ncbi:MAG: LysR family transcriptional regulator [Pseudomonadota bacterium]
MSGITLDQFRVFVTVVDVGSFAAAARQLNRTQSAITYTIQKLEDQTGLVLFDRQNYRPGLTKAGQSLLPHAQKILAEVAGYRLHADGIARGLEASISIALSQYAPASPFVAALALFQKKFPTVRISILTITVQTTELLDNRTIDFAILPEYVPFGAPYKRVNCGKVSICAVARPDHPLAQFAGKIPVEAMEQQTQIITSSRTSSVLARNYAVQSLNYWQVNDLETKLSLILGGVGWGGMPEHMVVPHIANGALVRLDPDSWDGLDQMPILNIVAAHRQDTKPGPAGQWLLDHLRDTMSTHST